PGAVAIARHRGCAVVQRSVFDRLPLEGTWGTVLLLDGNIGIGGDPVKLLRRCGALLRDRGTVVVEVEAPSTTSRVCLARLERGGESSAWFPWAVVGAGSIGELASSVGLHPRQVWEADENRWFAVLAAVT
ncbi:MAG: class I SAM-dependent methyltransferase, partial [Acidimicrobiales bacterium]